jgi:hypothetical protein
VPSRSKAQFRFFQAMKNDPEQAKEMGLSKETIKDYTSMTKKRFAKLKEKISKKNG